MQRFGARGLLQSARGLAQPLRCPRITARDRLGSDFHDVANVRLDRTIAFLALEILAMALLCRRVNGNMRHDQGTLTAHKIRVNMVRWPDALRTGTPKAGSLAATLPPVAIGKQNHMKVSPAARHRKMSSITRAHPVLPA